MRAIVWMIALILGTTSLGAAASSTLETTLAETEANAIASAPGTAFDSDRAAASAAPTGRGLEIHGELATGVAYSSGHGTATAESARINLHKALAGDTSFDMALGLANYDGFDNIHPVGLGLQHRP